jgi:hypothetical protein
MNKQKFTVPRFEPEVVEAHARKHWHGDTEKVPDTPLKNPVVDGVTLISRYSKAHELEKMAEMLQGVSPDLRRFIESIFCDSKATNYYVVEARLTSKAEAEKMLQQLEVVCMQKHHGHNGITVKGMNDIEVNADADWDEAAWDEREEN